MKQQLEAMLRHRFGNLAKAEEQVAPRVLLTGIPEVDAITRGIPRGAITEIFGTASSGRTTVALSILQMATARQETCALVDCNDALDVVSASSAGVDLNRLLWIRCAADIEHAFKVTDLLLHGGGFGTVVLDLADIAPQLGRRIPSAFWFRFRRSIESTPTCLVALGQEPYAKSCSALILHMKREDAVWNGHRNCSYLLNGVRLQAQRRKPMFDPGRQASLCRFEAKVPWV